jgi:hypothetical protein
MLFLCSACASAFPVVWAQTSPSSPRQVEDKLTKKERWTLVFPGVSAGVALIGAFLSFMYFRKNVKLSKQIADRTVTVESQKLLLEINKQYLSDPTLFAIYKDYPGRDQLLKDPKFLDKLKALGYLKLNVFEIVFAALPTEGSSYKAWEAYFEDSLKRCPVLVEELSAQREIYDSHLIAAYDRWFEKQPKTPRYRPC